MVFLKNFFFTFVVAILLTPTIVSAVNRTPRCVGQGRFEMSLLSNVKLADRRTFKLSSKAKTKITITSLLSKKRQCVSTQKAQLNRKAIIRKLPRDAKVLVEVGNCKKSFKMRLSSKSKLTRIALVCKKETPLPTPTPESVIPFTFDEFNQNSIVSEKDGLTTIDILPETYAQAQSLAIYPSAIQELAKEAFSRQQSDELLLQNASVETIRARRLQGAVDFANLTAKSLMRTKVRIIIPPATYNVLSLSPQPGRKNFTDLSVKDAPYMPRLSIAVLAFRSSVELLSPWEAYPATYASFAEQKKPSPLLTYNDTTCSTKNSCRARVILHIPVNQVVTVKGLSFEGDHDHEFRSNYEFYVHENIDRKKILGLGRIGLIMVGTYSSSYAAKVIENKVILENLVLSKINFRGIQVFGNAHIVNSKIKGIIELPKDFVPVSQAESYRLRTTWIEDVRAGITPLLHASDDPGQSWNAGIYIDSSISSKPSIVEHNKFENLLQGLISLSLGEGSSFSYNTATYILDHVLYSLVSIKKGSKISHNHITKTVGFALKFAGHSDAADTASLAGVNGSEITNNYFFHTRDGLIALTGSNNYIANNQYDPYEPALDETGGWFNPINNSIPSTIIPGGGSLNPKIMISVFGGNSACVSLPKSSIQVQPGFANTTVNNVLENNFATAGSANRHPRYKFDTMTIFIDQAPGSSSALYNSYMGNKYADRSIDGSIVLLAKTPETKAYFRTRTRTNFASGISTDSPSQFSNGIPPTCKGCEYTANSVSDQAYELNPCT